MEKPEDTNELKPSRQYKEGFVLAAWVLNQVGPYAPDLVSNKMKELKELSNESLEKLFLQSVQSITAKQEREYADG